MDESTGVHVAAATEHEVPLLLRMIVALAEYERLAHHVVATEEGLRTWLFGEAAVAEAALARVGGEPVGFALWFRSFSTFLGRPGLYLEDLFVLPEWRGRGIGRALLAHLAAETVARGYGRLEWSVLNWNEPAIAFYERLGARAMDGWTVYRLTGEALEGVAESRGAVR